MRPARNTTNKGKPHQPLEEQLQPISVENRTELTQSEIAEVFEYIRANSELSKLEQKVYFWKSVALGLILFILSIFGSLLVLILQNSISAKGI